MKKWKLPLNLKKISMRCLNRKLKKSKRPSKNRKSMKNKISDNVQKGVGECSMKKLLLDMKKFVKKSFKPREKPLIQPLIEPLRYKDSINPLKFQKKQTQLQ